MTLAVSSHRVMNGPLFVPVFQAVVHNMGGLICVLRLGESVSYNRHGRFRVAAVGMNWAVIEHDTLGGKTIPVFLPEKTGMNISNGAFRRYEVHHPSYVQYFAPTIMSLVKLKICFECGSGQIDQRYEFCPHCGHKLIVC